MKPSSGSYWLFAFLQFIVLFIAIGMAGMGFGGLFGAQNKQQELMGERLLILGGVLSILAGLLLVLALATAAAMRFGWSWGAGVARVTTYLALLEFPLGTAFAIYWFRQRK